MPTSPTSPANTVYKDTGKPILPPYEIRKVEGVKVGFVGLTLEGTPDIVNPAGISEVDFLDEVETANKYARELKARGVEALVLLLHEGGQQNGTVGLSDCNNFTGPVKEIVAGLRGEYGLVVSGHTHRYYTCSLPNSAGGQTRRHQRRQQRPADHRRRLLAGPPQRPVHRDQRPQHRGLQRCPQRRRHLAAHRRAAPSC